MGPWSGGGDGTRKLSGRGSGGGIQVGIRRGRIAIFVGSRLSSQLGWQGGEIRNRDFGGSEFSGLRDRLLGVCLIARQDANTSISATFWGQRMLHKCSAHIKVHNTPQPCSYCVFSSEPFPAPVTSTDLGNCQGSYAKFSYRYFEGSITVASTTWDGV